MQTPLTREVAHDKAFMYCNTLVHSTSYILRPCGNKVLVWIKHKNTELKTQYDPNCIKLGIEAIERNTPEWEGWLYLCGGIKDIFLFHILFCVSLISAGVIFRMDY